MEKSPLRPVDLYSSAENLDYSFHDLLEKYVRRVADKCELPEIVIDKLINKVDLSVLPPVERTKFEDWLSKSFYVRISIENVLRSGKSVKAVSTQNVATGRVSYSIRIA